MTPSFASEVVRELEKHALECAKVMDFMGAGAIADAIRIVRRVERRRRAAERKRKG